MDLFGRRDLVGDAVMKQLLDTGRVHQLRPEPAAKSVPEAEPEVLSDQVCEPAYTPEGELVKLDSNKWMIHHCPPTNLLCHSPSLPLHTPLKPAIPLSPPPLGCLATSAPPGTLVSPASPGSLVLPAPSSYWLHRHPRPTGFTGTHVPPASPGSHRAPSSHWIHQAS